MPTKQVAEKSRVSLAWVRRRKQRRGETGEITPRSSRPQSAMTLLTDHLELLEQLVRHRADTTREELRSQLPVAVSVPALSRTLLELKLSFKKGALRHSCWGRVSALRLTTTQRLTRLAESKMFCLRPNQIGRTSNGGVRLGKSR